ncbi:MAG: Ig-like domain-containing protein, partial [Myxococcales bacterium]
MTCSMKRMLAGAVVVATSIAWTSCSDSSQGAYDNEAALLSVSPRGNSTDVDPNARIRLEFQHEMQDGMEELCVLYRGGLDGDEVPGNWEWSEEHHVLHFVPRDPLQHDAEHTLHVGGGMIDVHGHAMNFDQHGHDMGGHWV